MREIVEPGVWLHFYGQADSSDEESWASIEERDIRVPGAESGGLYNVYIV